MREIKFRVWHAIEWDEADKPTKYQMTYDWAFEEYGTLNDQLSSVPNIMQYTGLKDVKGREIYEGDVVVEEIETGKYQPFVVKWHNDYAGFDMSSSPCWTILGNIYENPELL